MNHTRVLVTGSEGLIGTALCSVLESRGYHVVELDLLARGESHGDVRDAARVRAAVHGCDGVVHLAAVSRVVWAERDHELCWSTNVGGVKNIVKAALEAEQAPWLVFASSREVYGQPDALPATEDTPLRPVNIYGRSKVEGERLINEARDRGLSAAIVRLSNVYGSTRDHADRVVPAFARAAVSGSTLRVEGSDHTFDFTHIDDTVRGILALIDRLASGASPPPPIHLLTGRPTTLGELASLAVEISATHAPIAQAPRRSFDVSYFYGVADRARMLLNWKAQVGLREGLERLIRAYRAELGGTELQEAAQ